MTSSMINVSHEEFLRSLKHLKKQTENPIRSSKKVKFNLQIQTNENYKLAYRLQNYCS